MPTEPVVVVIPGDLHLTEVGLENHRVAQWMVEEVNRLIRPDFVQFIGDNVQDALPEQFRLFDDLRRGLQAPHFVLVGDHDVKGDPFAADFRRHVGAPYGSISVRGFRFVRLNTQESRPLGLSPWTRKAIMPVEVTTQRVINQRHVIWEKRFDRIVSEGEGRFRLVKGERLVGRQLHDIPPLLPDLFGGSGNHNCGNLARRCPRRVI